MKSSIPRIGHVCAPSDAVAQVLLRSERSSVRARCSCGIESTWIVRASGDVVAMAEKTARRKGT